MEIRKVQITGGSSYIITLPKEWVKSVNIKKNDSLGLIIQSDGTLLVTPKMTHEHYQGVKEFDAGSITEQNYLLRGLIGAYISGYDIIKINLKTRLSPFARKVVRRFTTTTIGQEVVEESDTSIIIKDLLDPTEMPFDRTLKRMQIIVKGMLEDTVRALNSNDKTLAEDVISRDNDVDRLHWLVARQHNIILRNIGLAEKMNTTIEMSSTCFLISRIIERIGDHIVRISQNVLKLIDANLDKKIINQIISTSDQALRIFNKSTGSFFKKDIKASNENIESVTTLESLCEDINTLALQQEGALAISVGYIVESIRRIGEYAEDISETVINYLISEEKS